MARMYRAIVEKLDLEYYLIPRPFTGSDNLTFAIRVNTLLNGITYFHWL